MSTLYLATDPLVLAEELAAAIDRHLKREDLFAPVPIVVPNRYLGKWLRLWLARKFGVAINLEITFLEKALWGMLRGVDPRPHEIEPEMLDGDAYRLLVLSVLLGEDNSELAPLKRYFGANAEGSTRRASRRAWDLADRLSGLIRDYEYHRQDSLIQPWIADLLGKKSKANPADDYERSQRALFQHIIRDPSGKRALLNQATQRNLKTLPQYAMEVWELLCGSLGTGVAGAEALRSPSSRTSRRFEDSALATRLQSKTWHLFGITQISALHNHTLRWLGRFFDFQVYHLNPLVGRLKGEISPRSFETAVQSIDCRTDLQSVPPQKDAAVIPGQELLSAWGHAGAEGFRLIADLLTPAEKATGPRFHARLLSATAKSRGRAPRKKTGRVLKGLQQQLLNQATGQERLPQDDSLQIAGCPGKMREVETVYHSILHNLASNPALKQTDIAVLVTDMATYRPTIQAVFKRPPRHLTYNLADFSAAGLSTYGQAFLDMLDLALESFTRSKVFDVLLNPCFLARLGVQRDQAEIWLHWAEKLCIHHGWDAAEKRDHGYSDSPFFGWRLGLQRLRLGQYMETTEREIVEASDRPARRFGGVLPFADIHSADREELDAFSRAVEGLLPELVRLRRHHGPGKSWSELLHRLGQNFLDIPDDRPEEAQVRDRLFDALEHLTIWDQLSSTTRRVGEVLGTYPTLALVRELVRSSLETIEGSHGEYLTGGVTISALQPMRPVPFPILYILGLGEDLFPGSNRLPTIDLRSRERLPGDIRPAENARFLFLESLLAAREKVYLLYNNRDLQKDQVLLPAAPLLQLKRYLEDHIVEGELKIANAPLHHRDPESLVEPTPERDVLIHYDDNERLIAAARAQEEGRLQPDLLSQASRLDRLKERVPDFSLAVDKIERATVPSINIKEIKRLLENPAKAALKRHLQLEDDDDDSETPTDDEPFVTPTSTANKLMRLVLERVVRLSVIESPAHALASWQDLFNRLYDEWRLRSLVPEGAFGEIDRESLAEELKSRLDSNLAEFLQRHGEPGASATAVSATGVSTVEFCGPILLGEAVAPVGPRLRFPALKLSLPRSVIGLATQAARLSGVMPLAWSGPSTFEILVLCQAGKLDAKKLSPYLFEPVLFYLALRAQTEPGSNGQSGRDWLAKRTFYAHVCHRKGLDSFTYQPHEISSEEAGAYLSELAVDLLDPTSFDLLPFDVISKKEELSKAFMLPDEDRALKAGYAEKLDNFIQEAAENTFGNYGRSEVVELARAAVPNDAYAKVRRRFRYMALGLGTRRATCIRENDRISDTE
ncbi:MAG: exodeoxyribonuclease V subunit gamma [Planctomycetes bacterium]|nr:exodeoxyribonuclease V subunit gamma [Planctomycetota bacterium]